MFIPKEEKKKKTTTTQIHLKHILNLKDYPVSIVHALQMKDVGTIQFLKVRIFSLLNAHLVLFLQLEKLDTDLKN